MRRVRRADSREARSKDRQDDRVAGSRAEAVSAEGILGMRFDEDENPWLALQFQGGIAKFDKKTEKFQTWSLPRRS